MLTAQALIKAQFQIQGLQSTLLQKSIHPIPKNLLKIVYCHGKHWIIASTILSSPGVILVYDSLYDCIDSKTAQVILNLFGNNHLKLQMVDIKNKWDLANDYVLLMYCSSTCKEK